MLALRVWPVAAFHAAQRGMVVSLFVLADAAAHPPPHRPPLPRSIVLFMGCCTQPYLAIVSE